MNEWNSNVSISKSRKEVQRPEREMLIEKHATLHFASTLNNLFGGKNINGKLKSQEKFEVIQRG